MVKGMGLMFVVLVMSLGMAFLWNHLPIIKESAHALLDPTAGRLLDWNVTWGLIAVSFIVALITTIIQKYATDNDLLREIKKEQKLLQEEMKKFKEHPEKFMELQKKQLEFLPRTMDITLRPALYTAIPFVLLIRWFSDYFVNVSVKIFGFISWIWAYIIFMVLFSMILRKLFKLP